MSAVRDTGVPQIRIASTGDILTTQINDGDQGILIATTTGANDARAALGVLNRPWERRPSVVVAPASEAVAVGLLEAIGRLTPDRVIVAGAPGDSAAWAAIERFCREHSIDISYLDAAATVELSHLTLTIVPPRVSISSPGPAYVVVSRGELTIAIALSGLPEDARFHVAVSSARGPATADLVIAPEVQNGTPVGKLLVAERGRRVILLVEDSRIRARGGRVVE
jgi:hypothetical protein